MTEIDVVVIGAGLAGLSAAGHLALEGKKVMVIEHHAVPGGYAHEFKRKGYRFEVALHALDGAGPGGSLFPVLRHLGVTDQIDMRRLDPLYSARFPDHEIEAPADLAGYRANLVQQFPETQVDQFLGAVEAVRRDLGRFTKDRTGGQRPSPIEIAANYPAMAAAFTQSWKQFLEATVDHPQLAGVLSALWGYFGLPPSLLNGGLFASALSSYHRDGGWYPVGGSQAMSRTMEATVVENGGSVLFRNTVTKVEPNSNGFLVTTHRGLEFQTRAVISTASPLDTVDMVGAEHFPDNYTADLRRDTPAVSNLVVYLGLDRDIASTGWDHHEYFLADTYDIEADYSAMMGGDFQKAGMVITNYTHSDPGCAPLGGSVLVLMTLAPWDHAEVWGTGGNLDDYSDNLEYQRVKDQAGDQLISRAQALIPGLRDSIVVKEVATPLTNVRYGRQPGGTIYGREQTIENVFLNRRSPKTPIPNLLLAGMWVSGGGMSTAIQSGKRVAAMVAKAG